MPAARSWPRRGTLSASRREAAPKFAQAARSASSPTWRWSARASRSGSTTVGSGRAVDRRGHRQRRVLPVAERRRGPAAAGADRLGRRAVARDAGAQDAGGRGRQAGAKTLIFDEVDAGIGGRVATVVGQKLRVARRALPGALHHAPAADCGGGPHALPDREDACGARRTVTSVSRLDGEDRVEEIARMMGGAAAGEQALESARELLDDDEGERRKAKGESRPQKAAEARRRKPQVQACKHRAMKYFIETYGCQMNVHDSERMAGLLEASGYDRADSGRATPTWSSSTPAACARRPRTSSTRGSARSRRWAASTGRDPIVAVAGCVAQQEGEQAARALRRLIDVVVGTQRVKMLPMLVDAGAQRARGTASTAAATRAHRDRQRRTTSRRSRSASSRRGDPVKAYVTIIEGCNDFCAFCVVPYTRGHERMRAKAEILADVREAVGSGRQEVQLLGQIVNHYQAPDDPACDFPGAARSGPRRSRRRPHPLCEPASAARQRSPDRRGPRPAEGLQAPAPAGAVRLDARARS